MKLGAYQIPVSNWNSKEHSDALVNASATRLSQLAGLQKAYESVATSLTNNVAHYVKNQRDRADASTYASFLSNIDRNNKDIKENLDLLNNPNTPYEEREVIEARLKGLRDNDTNLRNTLLLNVSPENSSIYAEKVLNNPYENSNVTLALSAEQQAKALYSSEVYRNTLTENPALKEVNDLFAERAVDIRSTAYNSKERQDAIKDYIHNHNTYLKGLRLQLQNNGTPLHIIQEIEKQLNAELDKNLASFNIDPKLAGSAQNQYKPLSENLPPSTQKTQKK